jgi:hypothetical protein
MVLDIHKTVFRIQLRRFIVLMVFIIFVLAAMLLGKLHTLYFGLSKYQLALLISAFYVLYTLFESFLELYYIYFSDEGDNLQLRFFSLSILNRKKQAIEIPKASFGGYTVKKSMGGLKTKLILYHKLKTSKAKYPEVSIAALSNNEKQMLFALLNKYHPEILV